MEPIDAERLFDVANKLRDGFGVPAFGRTVEERAMAQEITLENGRKAQIIILVTTDEDEFMEPFEG